MKLVFSIVAVFLCAASSVAAKPINVFGRDFDTSIAVYGTFFVPPGVSERARENAKFELYVRPSITLKKYNKKTSLVGYAIFAFLNDSQGFSFNNKATFTIGLQLQHKLSPAVRVSFGGRWKIDRQFSTGIKRSKFIFTADLSLYKSSKPDWVKQNLPEGTRFIVSGWANYRYPSALGPSEKNNGLLQGSVKFAASIPIKKTKLSIVPYVSLKAKADHKGRAFNNIVEPALGLEIKVPFKGGGNINFGVKSVYQWRHSKGTNKTGILGYVSWYKRF